METLAQIVDAMRANGLRITKARLAVAKTLLENRKTLLSPEEIYIHIKSDTQFTCDLVSVYRALATFEKLALIKKSAFRGDAARYTLKIDTGKKRAQHEHFFKCLYCNIIESFEGCLVSKKEKELEKVGYKQLNHHLEITGICPNCSVACAFEV